MENFSPSHDPIRRPAYFGRVVAPAAPTQLPAVFKLVSSGSVALPDTASVPLARTSAPRDRQPTRARQHRAGLYWRPSVTIKEGRLGRQIELCRASCQPTWASNPAGRFKQSSSSHRLQLVCVCVRLRPDNLMTIF